jgi:hypothetical protein
VHDDGHPQATEEEVRGGRDRGRDESSRSKEQSMAVSYAGAVDVEPRLSARDILWIRERSEGGWLSSRDGRRLHPRQGAELVATLGWLREFVAATREIATLAGAVAAYDEESGELTLLTVRDGRVTRRRLAKRELVRPRSNVIDLATHRRALSRAIY